MNKFTDDISLVDRIRELLTEYIDRGYKIAVEPISENKSARIIFNDRQGLLNGDKTEFTQSEIFTNSVDRISEIFSLFKSIEQRINSRGFVCVFDYVIKTDNTCRSTLMYHSHDESSSFHKEGYYIKIEGILIDKNFTSK